MYRTVICLSYIFTADLLSVNTTNRVRKRRGVNAMHTTGRINFPSFFLIQYFRIYEFYVKCIISASHFPLDVK